MIAILGDFRSFAYFDETCLTDKNGDNFFSFGIELLRHNVVTNAHVVPEKLDAERKEVVAVFVGKASLIEVREATKVACLLYTSPSPRDRQKSRMPSSA